MTANELATFLKEEVPRIKKHAAEFPYKDTLRSDEADLLSALTACVGLLREAAVGMESAIPTLEWIVERAKDNEKGKQDLEQYKALLATLRLVVGEGESHPSIQGG